MERTSHLPDLNRLYFQDISRQLKINAEIIMRDVTEHTNREIERFKEEIKNATQQKEINEAHETALPE